MPRLLTALILFIILVIYYIYKTQTQEEIKTESIQQTQEKIEVKKVVKQKPVSKKKQDFYDMMIPPLDEVYAELMKQYWDTKGLLQVNPDNPIIQQLKRKYRVKSNEDLLIALKPHPKSIAIAQGAMESAWGTSRFFKKAYNIFGVWSFNKNDKRIAAGETRGSQTIWLRKYDTVKEAIHDYYLVMSRSPSFREFKRLNHAVEHANPYILVTKLDKYSEKGAAYGKELASMITYNALTQHDAVHYEPIKEVKQQTASTPKPSAKSEHEKLEEVVDTIQDNESTLGDILKEIKKEP